MTGTEAGRIPRVAWMPENTVLVGVAQARDIEFDAKYAGDWMLHCHLPHHMMNQMVSMVGPVIDRRTATGLPAAAMEDGMGMLPRGDALDGALRPQSRPRRWAVGADAERAVTNLPIDAAARQQAARRPRQPHEIPVAANAHLSAIRRTCGW